MPEGATNPMAPPPKPRSKYDRGGRRPPKYDPEYHPKTASKLIDFGLTDQQCADFFEVGPDTIWRWKLTHPEYAEAVELTPERRLKIVENSLYLRATGYTHPAVKIFAPTGNSKNPLIVPYTEYHPPETGAASMYLHNRDPKRWKNRKAPPEDPPLPGAAQEADRQRRIAFATLVALIEERAREGKPPLLAHLRPQHQQPLLINARPNGAVKGNGHKP